MIINLPKNSSNIEFNISVKNNSYTVKITYNCTFNKFFAIVINSNNLQASNDCALTYGADLLKSTDIPATLIFAGQEQPEYGKLTGWLELNETV
jgi:hypothetical protein